MIDPVIVLTAGLVFIRVGAILFALPVFGDNPTPVQVRILMSAALSVCIWPLIPVEWRFNASTEPLALAWSVVREIVIGLLIGYVARIAFDGIIMAASLVGYQMGFGTASLFIPDAGMQMDGFTAFHRILVIIIFLTLNLHHVFLSGLIDTFRFIPPGGALPNAGSISQILLSASSQVFSTAIQLSAPVLVALMFAMAALGLMARAVPQLNVFVLSFPLSFAIGLGVYIATIPFFPEWMQSNFSGTRESFVAVIRSLKP